MGESQARLSSRALLLLPWNIPPAPFHGGQARGMGGGGGVQTESERRLQGPGKARHATVAPCAAGGEKGALCRQQQGRFCSLSTSNNSELFSHLLHPHWAGR